MVGSGLGWLSVVGWLGGGEQVSEVGRVGGVGWVGMGSNGWF